MTAVHETASGHMIVSRQEWLASRRAHLEKEKEITRLRDALARERRELPWVRVEKEYVFEAPEGRLTLAELFDGRSQLIVQHFMFGPGWTEGCVGCSFQADHVDGTLVHLAHRDVTFVAVSRATLPEIEAFRGRMGWRFRWVSSYGSDFNYDYHVSFTRAELAAGEVLYNYEPRRIQSEELPGVSVFHRPTSGDIFHTYSSHGRGPELLIGTYNYLDLVPKGRDEEGLSPPMGWVRHHDSYGNSA